MLEALLVEADVELVEDLVILRLANRVALGDGIELFKEH